MKMNQDIAEEVIAGKWGNGEERRKQLSHAGYNSEGVQQLVHPLVK